VQNMSESMQEMMEREKAEAIATLKRANSALSRIFGIEEDSSVGTCDKCNSWDDSLEAGVCQTCIKGEGEDE
jgi:hypothetical protein